MALTGEVTREECLIALADFLLDVVEEAALYPADSRSAA